MVHRMDTLNDSPPSRKNLFVKTEFDEHNFFPISKRPKFDSFQQEYNPLDEPSPLGLKLKKSPSFLELIQIKLSQERTAPLAKTLAKKEINGGVDKIKASNFPATLLKIGTWQYKSRYEGDLVAKCYFAKHKLVWEVLDGGLKNKIEIQWSDIMAIKANYPDDAPGTLDVVLARQPLFFREINPQPRKHTLWQATSDFTSGQATIHRRHFIQFSQGILGKHFEKLMQCDPRLSYLSQQPEIVLDSPYFQPVVSTFGDHNEHDRSFGLMTPNFPNFRSTVSGSGLSSSDFEQQEPVGSSAEYTSQRTYPPILEETGSRKEDNETQGLNLPNQIKLLGLHPSMSVADLVNHIGECISEQMKSNNPNICIDKAEKNNILEEITQYLLSDCNQTTTTTTNTTVSDEKYIMSRVNSLCCLLHKEPSGVPNLDILHNDDSSDKFNPVARSCESQTVKKESTLENVENGCKQETGISRKDSVDELLLNLPRIASLPQFLSIVPEDSSNEGR